MLDKGIKKNVLQCSAFLNKQYTTINKDEFNHKLANIQFNQLTIQISKLMNNAKCICI